jgi:hypothetical protein
MKTVVALVSARKQLKQRSRSLSIRGFATGQWVDPCGQVGRSLSVLFSFVSLWLDMAVGLVDSPAPVCQHRGDLIARKACCLSITTGRHIIKPPIS